MTTVLILLLCQGALGALDTFWHHELGGLPGKASARRELVLHAAREAIYALVFLTIGWVAWQGALAWVLAGLLAVELVITLADFLEEDRSRRLPPSERVLHTLMAIGFGLILAVFAPVLLTWAAAPTGFAFEPHGLLSWAASLAGAGVLVWAIRDGMAAAALRGPTGARRPAHPAGRTLLITGATGFVGSALADVAISRGDRVVLLVRDARAARIRFGPSALICEDLDQVPAELRIDAIVNLAGAPTAGGLWTHGRKRLLLESRRSVTRAVVRLAARLETRPAVLISASAVGYYGDRGDELLSETAGPQDRFMSHLCRLWEAEALKAQTLGIRVCLLRLGLVFDTGGGPLPMLTLSARLGLGVVFGAGRQWLPWIHRHDVIRVIDAAIACERYSGPLNLAVPQQVTQEDFARSLARELRRPLFVRAPAFLMSLALGDFADLFLAGQRASPARLIGLGFNFERPDLAEVLRPQSMVTTTLPMALRLARWPMASRA